MDDTQPLATAAATVPGRNGGTLTPITSGNAREMQARSAASRRRKAMRAAQDHITRAARAVDPDIETWHDAYGVLVAGQFEAIQQAASEGKPRGDDARFVAQAVGALPAAHEREAADATHNTLNVLGPEQARAVLARLLGGEKADEEAAGGQAGKQKSGWGT